MNRKGTLSEPLNLIAKNSMARESLGIIKTYQAKYPEAIASLDEAIRLDPMNENYLLTRGFCKSMLRDYQGAIRDYDDGAKMQPEKASSWRSKALL